MACLAVETFSPSKLAIASGRAKQAEDATKDLLRRDRSIQYQLLIDSCLCFIIMSRRYYGSVMLQLRRLRSSTRHRYQESPSEEEE